MTIIIMEMRLGGTFLFDGQYTSILTIGVTGGGIERQW